MMSLEVLEAVNRDIRSAGGTEGARPLFPAGADEVDSPWFCPNIGSLKPRGWKRTGQTCSWTRPAMAMTGSPR